MSTSLVRRSFMIRNDQITTDYITEAASLSVDNTVWNDQGDQRFNGSNVFVDQWYGFFTFSTSLNDTLFLTWLTTYIATHPTFQYKMFSQTVNYG